MFPHINASSWKFCKHSCLHRWMKVTKLCAKIKSSCSVYAKLFDPPKANSFYHIYFIVFCCSNLGQITRAFNHTINNGVTFLSFRAQYQVKNRAGWGTWKDNTITSKQAPKGHGSDFSKDCPLNVLLRSLLSSLLRPSTGYVSKPRQFFCVLLGANNFIHNE